MLAFIKTVHLILSLRFEGVHMYTLDTPLFLTDFEWRKCHAASRGFSTAVRSRVHHAWAATVVPKTLYNRQQFNNGVKI